MWERSVEKVYKKWKRECGKSVEKIVTKDSQSGKSVEKVKKGCGKSVDKSEKGWKKCGKECGI